MCVWLFFWFDVAQATSEGVNEPPWRPPPLLYHCWLCPHFPHLLLLLLTHLLLLDHLVSHQTQAVLCLEFPSCRAAISAFTLSFSLAQRARSLCRTFFSHLISLSNASSPVWVWPSHFNHVYHEHFFSSTCFNLADRMIPPFTALFCCALSLSKY